MTKPWCFAFQEIIFHRSSFSYVVHLNQHEIKIHINFEIEFNNPPSEHQIKRQGIFFFKLFQIKFLDLLIVRYNFCRFCSIWRLGWFHLGVVKDNNCYFHLSKLSFLQLLKELIMKNWTFVRRDKNKFRLEHFFSKYGNEGTFLWNWWLNV